MKNDDIVQNQNGIIDFDAEEFINSGTANEQASEQPSSNAVTDIPFDINDIFGDLKSATPQEPAAFKVEEQTSASYASEPTFDGINENAFTTSKLPEEAHAINELGNNTQEPVNIMATSDLETAPVTPVDPIIPNGNLPTEDSIAKTYDDTFNAFNKNIVAPDKAVGQTNFASASPTDIMPKEVQTVSQTQENLGTQPNLQESVVIGTAPNVTPTLENVNSNLNDQTNAPESTTKKKWQFNLPVAMLLLIIVVSVGVCYLRRNELAIIFAQIIKK